MSNYAMKSLLFVTLCCLCRIAGAFTPAQGLWLNPNESGRGYTIESQNNIMVVTAYVYTQGGAATWYLASGTYSSTSDTFVGTVYADAGGQCWGCAYKQPTETQTGQMTITFSSAETGVIHFPGGSTQIQHAVFGYANQTDYFLGAWLFSYNIDGLADSQWVEFTGHYTGSDGTVYASGSEIGVSNTAALAAFFPSTGSYVLIVQDEVGFSFAYVFSVGDDKRMVGHGVIYSTGTSPPTPSNPAIAARILTQAELSGSTGSITQSKAPMQSDPNARYAQLEAIMKLVRQQQ